MSTEKKNNKPNPKDYVIAESNPDWLNTPSPFECLDDDWRNIIIFYVFHVPVSDVSARAKSLESFGWGSKSGKNDFKQLKKRLIEYGNMTEKSFLCEDTWAKHKENLEKNNLISFPTDITTQRVTYRKHKSGVADSLLAHIRNAFAHGRIAFYDQNGKIYVAMEDIEDKKKHVSARMILSKDTLLCWKTIIESGPYKTNDELNKLFGVLSN